MLPGGHTLIYTTIYPAFAATHGKSFTPITFDILITNTINVVHDINKYFHSEMLLLSGRINAKKPVLISDMRQQLRVSGPSDWALVEGTLLVLVSRIGSSLASVEGFLCCGQIAGGGR